jgi:transcriptional regulator GlxA family with amidase domain
MSIRDASKRASSAALERSPHAVREAAPLHPRVQIAIEHMKANLHRRIALAELADVSNLSASHLFRLFKSHMRLSPAEYHRRLRMEKARQLIATSLLSIKEIMVMAGYNNRRHFLHHFRKSFGVSPSEYRRTAASGSLRDPDRFPEAQMTQMIRLGY